ncbi:hypothetical protein OsI_19651 [Oryza sativa Indica Group]|uniref:Uncharacterized protein n=1 Tax=Oryza sativa subsp. indica TaxID=39946 RepID=A2Y3R8_ORYSI|nr:hypothetical protein OsI_19651 [Oryza sativa Indica Group]
MEGELASYSYDDKSLEKSNARFASASHTIWPQSYPDGKGYLSVDSIARQQMRGAGGVAGDGQSQLGPCAWTGVGLGWLEVVGRVVGSGKASAMESLWKVVGAAKHGGGPVAAMARQLPSALATLGAATVPVDASGPRDSGGSRWCRWP